MLFPLQKILFWNFVAGFFVYVKFLYYLCSRFAIFLNCCCVLCGVFIDCKLTYFCAFFDLTVQR